MVWLPVASVQVWTRDQLLPLPRLAYLALEPSWVEVPVSHNAKPPDAPVLGYSVRTRAEPQTVSPAVVFSGTSSMSPPPAEAVLVAAKWVPL